MFVDTIYFAFHHPATLREVLRGEKRWTQIFGHVEAFGVTIDGTWFFYDPNRFYSQLGITHLHDEIEAELGARWATAKTIARMPYEPGKMWFPFHFPMNCVTQCAALVGIRAFTPRGFMRKLTRKPNAEVIYENPQRKSRGPEGPPAGTPPVPS